MALLNEKQGSIVAHCPGCAGGRSTFEWRVAGKELGTVKQDHRDHYWGECTLDFRLFKCAGCGAGAMGVVVYPKYDEYPGRYNRLAAFYRETKDSLKLPADSPKGIVAEFREAENCLANDCYRAAAGLFRSVLDKTMRANGYKTKKESDLFKQIEAAADEGVITQARKKRAHDEIRVLGNDVLHDDWHPIEEEDVQASRHYCQRILEDFYDDRNSVLALLRASNRVAEEDRPVEQPKAEDK